MLAVFSPYFYHRSVAQCEADEKKYILIFISNFRITEPVLPKNVHIPDALVWSV